MSRLEAAIRIAKLAGDHTLTHFQNAALKVEIKSDESPVTIADREAEQIMRREILAAYPDDSILGEEFGEHNGTSGYKWILDPIDGTVNFANGVPLYGTLIGIENDTTASIGVIHMPALGETLYASTGNGAWWTKNRSQPVRAQVSGQTSLKDATLAFTSVNVFDKIGRRDVWIRLADACKTVRGWGDCYGYLLVATGRADIMIDPLMHVWDCAPMLVILNEAGGKFSSWDGRETIHTENSIGTNGKLHAEVLNLIQPPSTPIAVKPTLPKVRSKTRILIDTLFFITIILLAAVVLFRKSRTAVTDSPETSNIDTNRLQTTLALHLHHEVVYEDMLGEGEGHWDSDPATFQEKVNCQTWLETFLADAYGKTADEKQQALTRIRYFGNTPLFGTRKHFLTHMLEHDPGPFKPVTGAQCNTRSETATLRFERFKSFHKYSCGLFRENTNTFTTRFSPAHQMESCANSLPDGMYILFAVPSAAYEKKYGKNTGPLGLAHGIIVQKAGALTTASHASITSHKVETLPLAKYISEMQRLKLHEGYAVYALNPAWDFRNTLPASDALAEISAIAACEKALVQNGQHRKSEF